MTPRHWIIPAAVVLGLCALNSALGDSTEDAQRAANHKSETQSAMRHRTRLEKQAHLLLGLDRMYAMNRGQK